MGISAPEESTGAGKSPRSKPDSPPWAAARARERERERESPWETKFKYGKEDPEDDFLESDRERGWRTKGKYPRGYYDPPPWAAGRAREDPWETKFKNGKEDYAAAYRIRLDSDSERGWRTAGAGKYPRRYYDSPPWAAAAAAAAASSSETEIKNGQEGTEAGSAASCRICFESNSGRCWRTVCAAFNVCKGDELISPCMCKGTQQFVHRSCLDQWRSVKEGSAFSHCTTCKAQFHFQVKDLENNTWRKIKFRIFVAWDVFLLFLAIQIVIAALAGLAYAIGTGGTLRNSFSNRYPIPFYYCIGALAFLVLVGFFGLMMHCCSCNSTDTSTAGYGNGCYGWPMLDEQESTEGCFALAIVLVIVFAIFGIFYGMYAAIKAIHKIWQRHYHILTKRELTKEYEVKDLHGSYTRPRLDPVHLERLRMLDLL